MGAITDPLASTPRVFRMYGRNALEGARMFARDTTDGLGNLLTHPLRPIPPRDRPGPLWPRTGSARITGGTTERYYHGWRSPGPDPDYQKAQRARQPRQARTRTR